MNSRKVKFSRSKRINISRRRYCKYCLAFTSKGNLCKRLSACKIGCRQFCAQHAEMSGGKVKRSGKKAIKCSPPVIKKCRCNASPRKTPCVKKLTIIWNKDELNEYCKGKKTPSSRRELLKKRKSIIKSMKNAF